MTSKLCKCLCGSVSFTAKLDDKELGVCHCKMCRKWSSGPSMVVQAKLSDIKGADFITSYASSDWAERAFCKKCGANLYYKVTSPGAHSGAIHMSAGVIEDISDMTLTTEIFVDEQPRGYAFAGKTHRMTGAEVFAAFAPPED